MILIAYFDKDLETYKPVMPIPNCSDVEDFKRDLRAGLIKLYPDETANKFIGLQCVSIGSFNEEDGSIISHMPTEILDCDECLQLRLNLKMKKEVKE